MPKRFKFVFIPADLAESLQQWELEMPEGQEVECLIDRLKEHFAATGPRKTAAQIQAQQRDLMSKLPEGTSIDSRVLDVATSLNMVENISLLSNAKDNGFVGINMYVDDEGSIKGLPQNLRASDIAHCCGKPLEVKGDAFLARVMDNGDDFERLDLTLDEVSSGAPWVHQARHQNERKRQQESGSALMDRLRAGGAPAAPAPAAKPVVRELTPAEAAKEEGNAAFKLGDMQAAVDHYSRALELQPGQVAALNNRALARLKLQQWSEAEADCSAVLNAEPGNVKALLRRAAARAALGHAADAEADWRAVLAREPQNKEATAALAAGVSS
ncbi:SUMO-activating enzyme subunit 2 [Chlorella sorokiniana]|uniref:SUMO-activating enzyme subunit 2 n=1 Tax=Chlorella sorokiniana TaxID=3076 RepID=A0A2P6U4Y8_CHLSO|nr:SUMO-activating enzyme subunit 2 [Chlorella sorokiniana]|eukprot:PRW61388.1 SUMO-activating enzyme subunit 2 [Chlorella sorokiniana]